MEGIFLGHSVESVFTQIAKRFVQNWCGGMTTVIIKETGIMNNNQFLNKVQHDIENYQRRGCVIHRRRRG